MSENGEKHASAKENKPEKHKKKPVKIRVTLFFDGTLNNRMNIEEREKDSEIYKKYGKQGNNSYNNGRTNIAIMEPHVSGKKEDYSGEYDFVYKAYIAGQGAVTHKKDSIFGYAFAIGSTGVPDRAEEGVSAALHKILFEKDLDPKTNYIEKLSIDVFGFSRGAATARYAIHVLFEGRISYIDEDTGNVYYEWNPLSQRLNNFDYEIDGKTVEVRFAGLYDTVLSYLGSQWVPWTSNTLKQRAVARAKKVLHLAAAGEHRKDFPLHKIGSAIKKGVGKEYYLPGVHSDVGGSYNTANELKLESETDEDKKVYMSLDSEGIDGWPYTGWGFLKDNAMVINDNDPDIVRKDRADLIRQNWYKEDEIKVYDIDEDDEGNTTRSVLAVHRLNIHSSYCNIPLKIMADCARKPDVKLKINEKLEDRANIILGPEKELQKLEKVIRDYMASTNNSKPGDWIDDKGNYNNEELKKIRHKHFHFSACKMSPGYAPRFEWDAKARKYRRRRYYYDA